MEGRNHRWVGKCPKIYHKKDSWSSCHDCMLVLSYNFVGIRILIPCPRTPIRTKFIKLLLYLSSSSCGYYLSVY